MHLFLTSFLFPLILFGFVGFVFNNWVGKPPPHNYYLIRRGYFLHLPPKVWISFVLAAFLSLVVLFIQLATEQAKTADYNFINGAVLNKRIEKVSCSHSYECNCRQVCSTSYNSSTKKTETSCHKVCDTCYEHNNDFSYRVYSNAMDKIFTIDRIDPQGLKVPPRFEEIKVGDPVTFTSRYINYVKGSNSLFNKKTPSLATYPSLPEYSINIFDYYKAKKTFVVGKDALDITEWEEELAKLNSRVGPRRQINVILVSSSFPQDFVEALEAKWIGGKKNDVIVVIGNTGGKLNYVSIISWTQNESFKIKLREDIINKSQNGIASDTVFDSIETNVISGFERSHTKDFEYLKNDLSFDTETWVKTVLICLVACIVLNLFIRHTE